MPGDMSFKQNQYDRMAVDVNTLFERSLDYPLVNPPSYLKRVLNRYFAGALIKCRLYERLLDAGIIRFWFKEFKHYWIKVLEGRPLYLHDFFYLLGVYRQRFQDVETPDGAKVDEFLNSWQNRDTLYMLFGAVRRYAYQPLSGFSFEKWINSGDSVLEYGCGIAPIAHFLLNYSLKRDLKITIADIRQINSHYAKYCLGNLVRFLEIQPYQNPLEERSYDVVLMITVMEHLPNPVETVELITRSLKQEGVLIFDYILGDGDGQDTIEAVTQRGNVLDYIKAKYEILEGELLEDQSMGTIVCRKKRG